jgi:hypothetical protein
MKFNAALPLAYQYLLHSSYGHELYQDIFIMEQDLQMNAVSTVLPGLCQVVDNYAIYDLKPLNQVGVDKENNQMQPVVAEGALGSLYFNLCSTSWSMTKERMAASKNKVDTLPKSCSDLGSANAFYAEGGECKYSLETIKLSGIKSAKTTEEPTEKNLGFNLEFTSA